MATVIICIILLAFVVMGIRSFVKRATSGCCGSGGDVKKVRADKNLAHYNYKYKVNIEGMHCKNCKKTVENSLNSLGGVYAVANVEQKSAELYAKEKCDEQKIRRAINSCGFTAGKIKLCDETQF